MNFRLKAFGLHLLGSVCLLSLALGSLYLGWYRWPGWYLAGALTIALVLAGVDVVIGPLLTLVIAHPKKPRRELARDISIIVVVQLIAAGYGIVTLWNGRPLYYTYSEKFLEMVQAQDVSSEEAALGRKLNPDLAPHWYSLPRWIYAPLPKDAQLANKIAHSAVAGGEDVIDMPRYYQPWTDGLPDIRQHLRSLKQMTQIGQKEREVVAQRMRQLGFPADEALVLPMTGKERPLVAVIDPATTKIAALIRVD